MGERDSSIGDATAVYKEAAKLTDDSTNRGEAIYPTKHSRELIKKLASGEKFEASDLIVSKTVIAEARRNIDKWKPQA